MNYYERHLGDYARDTGHLSLLEHGAYNVLLDRYYATEHGIPAGEVYRVARANSAQERKAVDRVLAEFFVLEDGLYRKERVEREIERYREKSGKASASAKARWSKSKGNANASADAVRTDMRTHSDGTCVLDAPNLQSPITSNQEGSLRSPSARVLSAEFEGFMRATYPEGKPDANFDQAAHFAMGLVGSGKLTEETLRRRVIGYRAYVDSQGVSGRQYVIKPQNWFNPSNPDKHWDKDWCAVPTKAQAAQDANIAASQAWLNRSANA